MPPETILNDAAPVDSMIAAPETEQSNDQTTEAPETEQPTGVPDAYEFQLPEGVTLDQEIFDEVTPLLKEFDLSQDKAQKLIDVHTKAVARIHQKMADDFNNLVNDWANQTKSDPEIGGDKFDESVKNAQLTIAKFGTPALKQLLNDYGVGNHPEVVRFAAKISSLLKEDKPTGGSPVLDKVNTIKQMYPND